MLCSLRISRLHFDSSSLPTSVGYGHFELSPSLFNMLRKSAVSAYQSDHIDPCYLFVLQRFDKGQLPLSLDFMIMSSTS